MGSALDLAKTVFGGDGTQNAAHVRALIRQGLWTHHTSGLADEHVQGNVVILPEAQANDFLRYCQRNPKPCPLLAVSEPGHALLPTLGRDINICTDVPRYRVWRDGELVEEPCDITGLWRNDLVTFVIGCSFSFEQALMDAGFKASQEVFAAHEAKSPEFKKIHQDMRAFQRDQILWNRFSEFPFNQYMAGVKI